MPSGLVVEGQEMRIDFKEALTKGGNHVTVSELFVPPALRGHGYGKDLARVFLCQADARQIKVDFDERVHPFFEKVQAERLSRITQDVSTPPTAGGQSTQAQ